MDEYTQKAAQEILTGLNFSKEQLDLVGRILSLDKDASLVRYAHVDRCTNLFINGRDPIFETGKPRHIEMRVVLQPELNSEDHSVLQEKIKKALDSAGVDSSGLFSYCTRSYGLELYDVEVHFGGAHYRAEKKLHPRDNFFKT